MSRVDIGDRPRAAYHRHDVRTTGVACLANHFHDGSLTHHSLNRVTCGPVKGRARLT